MKTASKSIMKPIFVGLLVALLFMAVIMIRKKVNRGWQKTFGGEWDDFGKSVQQTTDGGYIVVGSTYTTSHDPASRDIRLTQDVYLIKTDTSGNIQWQKTFGGEWDDFGKSVQQTKDGGYIVVGDVSSFGTGSRFNYDIYLVKTDMYGNIQWQKTFGEDHLSDYGNSVQQTTDGGYIVVGDVSSFGTNNYDIYLIKTDASGNI